LAVTAVAQLGVAVASGSVAPLGDSLHNFADALTALPLWLAFSLGRRPATRRFTYGYGRAEDVAGIFVVLMIAASGLVAAWEAVDRLRHPHDVRHVGFVMAAALIGLVGNEAVAAYRIRVGRAIGSASLVADGLHARSDASRRWPCSWAPSASPWAGSGPTPSSAWPSAPPSWSCSSRPPAGWGSG